jgi:hypothetical protein
MKLQENISRIKQMMGIITESTNKLTNNNEDIVLVSDYVKDHIKGHNKFGVGSTFREGLTDEDILNYVNTVLSQNELGDGGAFEIKIPNIGYDLVKAYSEAIEYPNANETTVIKKERGNDIEVPLIHTSATENEFTTDLLTLIIRKSNPNFLPDDVKGDDEIMKGIENGKVYSLLTAFPGNPNIPPASEWNGEYAVIVPTKEKKDNSDL